MQHSSLSQLKTLHGSATPGQVPMPLRHTFLILFALVAWTSGGYAQQTDNTSREANGAALLERLQNEYSRVEDYRVDIDAVLDIPGFRVPAMQARVYFKQPDKFKVESDGFAMLPRDAVHFSPAMFDPEMFDAVIQGTEKIGGTDCVKLTLLARSDTLRIQRATLFVETDRLLILKIKLTPTGGARVTANFSYTLIDNKYHLPSRIDIDMPTPNRFRRRDASDKTKDVEKDDMGHISLTYSNYMVNTGLSESLFDSDN